MSISNQALEVLKASLKQGQGKPAAPVTRADAREIPEAVKPEVELDADLPISQRMAKLIKATASARKPRPSHVETAVSADGSIAHMIRPHVSTAYRP